MSKHRVAVLMVVTNQSSVTAAAAEVGLSRGYLHRLLRRYREGGLEAFPDVLKMLYTGENFGKLILKV